MDLRRVWLCLGTGVCAVSAQAFTVPPLGEREALVRVVSRWDGNCEGSHRSSWDDMVVAWYNDITNPLPPPWGHGDRFWWRDGFYHGSWSGGAGYIRDSDFTDVNVVSWGRDHWNDRPDDVDACMVAFHGSSGSDGAWCGQMFSDEPGDGNCWTWQGHMEFGDIDLDFLHLSSCVSMDATDWHPNWSRSFKGVHQINGFEGVMYIYSSWPFRYRDFADDAFDCPIALAWLDNLYVYRCFGDDDDPTPQRRDQVPVSRGAGIGPNGQSNCWARMYAERYNDVWPTDPVNPTWHGVIYLIGSQAKGRPPLGGVYTGCVPTQAPADPFPAPLAEGFREVDDIPPLPRPLTESDYALSIGLLLPAFDSSILSPAPGPDWLPSALPGRIATALGDTTPEDIVADGWLIEARDTADTKVIKIDTDRGRVRYINRTRLFNWDSDPHTAWPETASLGLVLGFMNQLSIPTAEADLAATRVETVAGSDFENDDPSGTPFSTHEAERMVTIPRSINGLPVLDEQVRAAVSNYGQISRLLAIWPQFQLRPGLMLRPRQAVIDELAARIYEAEFGADIDVGIDLAYARFGTQYLPVARATLDNTITGLIIVVPLVDVPPDADADGVADSADNCPATHNPRQLDGDEDGVGDACDNCPHTYNPGQEDTDADGTGDVCATPEGGCFLPDGACETLTPVQCRAAAGTYRGDGTLCPNQPGLVGDANCDGVVDFGDINPFVLALSNPAAWQTAYPACDSWNCDIDGDGTVGFGDINPFVALLSNP
ncbi:MAG TPA: DUF6345 domain-containing protein [Phycisphaerae bacterium]|nr:DUF6345 domain-containing protein [Phycisphaerae bacterium]